MQTFRKIISALSLSYVGLGSLGISLGIGIVGCTNQDLTQSAPIETIHDFGSVSAVKDVSSSAISVPVEEDVPPSQEPALSQNMSQNTSQNLIQSSGQNSQKNSGAPQLIVQRHWTPTSADTPPKFEYHPAVTKTPVHFIVNGEMLSDDAGVLSIQAKSGEKVHSVEPGSIIYTGPSVQGGGQMVIVKNSEGILFAYSHLQGVSLVEGRHVEKGDVLGLTSNDPLVFQVRQAGGIVEAKKYIY